MDAKPPELPPGWRTERGMNVNGSYFWIRKEGYQTFCIDKNEDDKWRIEHDKWNTPYNNMCGYASYDEALQALANYLWVLEHEFVEPQTP